MAEITALPQFLRRTLSSKESWTRRRGSAPAPVAPSELGLVTLGAMRHSVNGGRRKPNPIVTCQQWLAKATFSVQERTIPQLPRRSSLPVEVLTGAMSANAFCISKRILVSFATLLVFVFDLLQSQDILEQIIKMLDVRDQFTFFYQVT